MPKVGIIGAGLIGRSWAMVFARAGWTVRLTDTSAAALKAAPALIRRALADQRKYGLVGNVAAITKRITVVPTLAEAVAGARLVQECGPENVEAKRVIFAQLDRAAGPRTILASSSTAIIASNYTKGLAGRARCLVAHPVNPPHLVPIVEICPAPWTSRAIVGAARRIYAQAGQTPILVRREVDGFIVNRLQGAVLAEAFRLIGEGYVSAEDLDKTIKDGLGLRWSFMGPIETIELNAPGGIPDYCARYTGFYKRFQQQPAPPSVYDSANARKVIRSWGQKLTSAQHAAKARWRDARLAALVAHKRGQKAFA